MLIIQATRVLNTPSAPVLCSSKESHETSVRNQQTNRNIYPSLQVPLLNDWQQQDLLQPIEPNNQSRNNYLSLLES